MQAPVYAACSTRTATTTRSNAIERNRRNASATETRCAHCFITFATGAELTVHKKLHCFPEDHAQVTARFPAGAAVFDTVVKQPAVVLGAAGNRGKVHACVSVQSANGIVADVAISRLERTGTAQSNDAGSTFRNATVDAALLPGLDRKLLACQTGKEFLRYALRNGAEEVKGGGHIAIEFGGKRVLVTNNKGSKGGQAMHRSQRKKTIERLVKIGIVALPTAQPE